VNTKVQLIGSSLAVRDLAQRAAVLDRAGARKVFREAAAMVRDAARRQAPRSRDSEHPGQLRKAITSFLSKRKGGRTRRLEAFASVNVRKGRVVAKHGLIIEAGRKSVSKVKAKALKFSIKGKAVFSATSRAVPANPFFQRAVDATQSRASAHVVSGLSRIIETNTD